MEENYTRDQEEEEEECLKCDTLMNSQKRALQESLKKLDDVDNHKKILDVFIDIIWLVTLLLVLSIFNNLLPFF